MASEACKTLPAVVTTGYTTKGSYDKLAGLDIYLVGPASAHVAIIGIYDIFGMAPQTLQGADMLAAALNMLIIIPDFFRGNPAKVEWVTPPETEEKDQLFDKFYETQASFSANYEMLMKLVDDAKLKFPLVTSWGAYGLCWGGKLAVLASGPDTPFKATAQTHPSRMSGEDAAKLTIPHLILASKDELDEEPDLVAEYARVIANGHGGGVEHFDKMHHGWMGARANLEDETNRKDFYKGYELLAEFFQKHLC